MSLNRYDARTDANQPQIIDALEAAGCDVCIIKWPVDLLASGGQLGRQNLLVECKVPGETLNSKQAKFFARWPGEKIMVQTPEQVIAYIQRRER